MQTTMKKNIVITGTSSGFGKLSVHTLAKDGHRVFATMRGVNGKNAEVAQGLRSWAHNGGHDVEVIELDVASDESVANATKEILSKTDRVDVVVNNAGIYGGGLNESYSIQDYKNIFEVNVFGSLRVINAFSPTFREQESGMFIQISSLMGRFVIPYSGAYTASKWAIEAIAETLRYELSPLGIDSTIVEPGAFPTELFDKTYQPENAAITSEYGKAAEYMQGFFEGFENMMSGDVPNHPQHVANAVKRLVDTPAGERPLRVPVDLMMGDTAGSINAASDKVQENFLNNMGLGNLTQVQQTNEVA